MCKGSAEGKSIEEHGPAASPWDSGTVPRSIKEEPGEKQSEYERERKEEGAGPMGLRSFQVVARTQGILSPDATKKDHTFGRAGSSFWRMQVSACHEKVL